MKTGEGWLAIWPVAAFFLGGLATQLAGYITHRRQRADKERENAAAQKQRREGFELQHLIEVNDLMTTQFEALHDLSAASRAVNRASHDGRTTEEAADQLIQASDQLEAAEAAAFSRVGFILADDVRTAVIEALQAMMDAARGALGNDSVDWSAVNNTIKPARDKLSARVRDIYAGR
ncbi:hypothetical protein ACWEQ7_04190 [Streptomyces sp. NPDC004069]